VRSLADGRCAAAGRRPRGWLRTTEKHDLEREVPLWIDLVRFGVEAGLNLSQAMEGSLIHLHGPMRSEVALVVDAVQGGQRLTEALEALGARQRSTMPAVAVLLATERYGAPVAVSLERLAQESRTTRTRMAERAGKRLSIVLILPVAGCFLSAFALLTVAPLIAGFLGGLASAFR
jgi:pilus assembly protein TadC